MSFELICKAAVAAGCAGVATALMARSSAARRHLVWMLALLAVLALPFVPPLWRAEPGTPLAVLAAAASTAAPVAAGAAWLQWLWMAGAVVLLLRLAAAHLRMAGTVGLGASGVMQADVPGALAWGLWNPVVVLPRGSEDPRDLAHEIAHVRRGDGWWLLASQIACAVYWFHPLVWFAARKAAEERERACDDMVLAGGAAPAIYAGRLVLVAREVSSAAALGMGGRNGLEARVRAILDDSINRVPLTPRFAAAAILGAVLMLAPMASSVAQTSPKGEKPYTTAPRLLEKVEPAYTQEAKDARVMGKVMLSVEISAEGRMTKAKVLESLDEGLDRNAVDAVRQWKFAPALKDGKPVACAATVELNFRLE